jgi:hypothetical protein
MKRFLALAAGALGLGALLRRARRRPLQRPPEPADALRAKLAESRSIVDEREVDEGAETTVDAAPDPDPATRRRELHEQTRRTMDELGR